MFAFRCSRIWWTLHGTLPLLVPNEGAQLERDHAREGLDPGRSQNEQRREQLLVQFVRLNFLHHQQMLPSAAFHLRYLTFVVTVIPIFYITIPSPN